jgi:hypothetical protein
LRKEVSDVVVPHSNLLSRNNVVFPIASKSLGAFNSSLCDSEVLTKKGSREESIKLLLLIGLFLESETSVFHAHLTLKELIRSSRFAAAAYVIFLALDGRWNRPSVISASATLRLMGDKIVFVSTLPSLVSQCKSGTL